MIPIDTFVQSMMRIEVHLIGFRKKGSTEECTCLSPEQFQYVDEFDDIDMVHEFSSLKDIKKTLLQIGTSFFLNKNQWSSSSLNEDDDDRGEAGSLKSEWSQGSESDQSVLGVIIANDFEGRIATLINSLYRGRNNVREARFLLLATCDLNLKNLAHKSCAIEFLASVSGGIVSARTELWRRSFPLPYELPC